MKKVNQFGKPHAKHSESYKSQQKTQRQSANVERNHDFGGGMAPVNWRIFTGRLRPFTQTAALSTRIDELY